MKETLKRYFRNISAYKPKAYYVQRTIYITIKGIYMKISAGN